MVDIKHNISEFEAQMTKRTKNSNKTPRLSSPRRSSETQKESKDFVPYAAKEETLKNYKSQNRYNMI